jgi:endosialidase-like protein
MTRTIPFVALLVWLSSITPSWSSPPNPTDSDANFNTAGGTGALDAVTTGESNTAFGYHGLQSHTTGDSNTAVGSQALASNTSGSFNTACGRGALRSNTNGGDNTATGANALFSNVGGSLNTAAGVSALHDNTTGNRNTATGFAALSSNTTASDNTATGTSALGDNTSGGNNTASGSGALSLNTTGSFNTASGAHALSSNITGIKNTAVGYQALADSTGSRNIAIGYQAGADLATGNNNIYIGHAGAANESLTMRLGSNQTRSFIAGIAGTNVNGTTVMIDGNGQLGVMLSSARYKRDITSLGTRSAGVLQLRPVSFAYREDAPGVVRYGLIAEEVVSVYPEMVTYTATGEVQSVRYQDLIPLLLNELQRQRRHLEHQQQVIARQHQELGELRATVEREPDGDSSRRSP